MTYTVREEAERIHQRAWSSQYAAAPQAFATATGLRMIELAEGVTQYLLPAIPFRMFNRVLGLGVFQPVSMPLIETALANFAQVGVENFAITLGPEEVVPAGLAQVDEWTFLTRAVTPVPEQNPKLTINDADPEIFGAVLARGYELPESVAAWGAGMARQSGWRPGAPVG